MCVRTLGAMTLQWSNLRAPLETNLMSTIFQYFKRDKTMAARQHCAHVHRSQRQQSAMKIVFDRDTIHDMAVVLLQGQTSPISHPKVIHYRLQSRWNQSLMFSKVSEYGTVLISCGATPNYNHTLLPLTIITNTNYHICLHSDKQNKIKMPQCGSSVVFVEEKVIVQI